MAGASAATPSVPMASDDDSREKLPGRHQRDRERERSAARHQHGPVIGPATSEIHSHSTTIAARPQKTANGQPPR